MQPTKKLSPVITALIVIVLVGVVVTAIVIANQSKKTASTTTSSQTGSNTASTADTSKSYKDGTYSEMGHYVSPGGAESIEVTVTLANDIITSADVTGDATSGESQMHQQDFISGYKSLVVGKDIDRVSLSRVSGSSLTSNGFNAALELIKADAQA
jgi:hypothetical protein